MIRKKTTTKNIWIILIKIVFVCTKQVGSIIKYTFYV